MDGFWIILEGLGGELDREFVADENEISWALRGKLTEWVLAEGDTIRIVEGWTEI